MADIPHFEASPYKMTEVLFKNNKGEWTNTEPFNQQLVLSGSAIGYFCRDSIKSGTGFVIKSFDDQNSLKSGIILTAAHLFYSNFKYIEEPVDFILGAETFEARPMTRIFDWENQDLFFIDPLSKEPISIPDDWIFCEIWRKSALMNEKFVALKANSEVSLCPGLDVFVIGYTKSITGENLNYAAPESLPSELHTIQRSIHYGRELVISSKKIVKIGQMIAISCASANGFSGSPVLILYKGEYKFIGLLHCGPAAFLHKIVAEVIHNSCNPRLKDMILNFYKKVRIFMKKKKAEGFSSEHRLKELAFELKRTLRGIEKGRFYDESKLVEIHQGYYDYASRIESRNGLKIHYNLSYPLDRNLFLVMLELFNH